MSPYTPPTPSTTTSVEYSTARSCIQIPCGAPAPPVVCFSRGCACMQPAARRRRPTCMMRHCRTKWTAFMGPIHSLRSPPVAVVERARAVRRGEGELHGRAPGEREGERERPAEQCWLLMNRSDFITPRLLHGHGYSWPRLDFAPRVCVNSTDVCWYLQKWRRP